MSKEESKRVTGLEAELKEANRKLDAYEKAEATRLAEDERLRREEEERLRVDKEALTRCDCGCHILDISSIKPLPASADKLEVVDCQDCWKEHGPQPIVIVGGASAKQIAANTWELHLQGHGVTLPLIRKDNGHEIQVKLKPRSRR